MVTSGWWAVAAAIIATGFWRLCGVMLYRHITSDSLLMRLINMLAYSLLGSVMMLLMIEPSGLLATSQITHRFIGLVCGITLLFFVKKLPVALMGAIGVFGFLSLTL